MSLIWRELPAWPLYVDAAGHKWKLAPNGYWWLHRQGFWHQAGSQAAGDVLGIPVPVYNPAGRETVARDRMNAACAAAGVHATNQIRAAFGVPPAHGGVNRLTDTVTHWRAPASLIAAPAHLFGGGGGYSAALNEEARANETPKQPRADPVPNIPPDFLPIPLSEGCCAECHLDDGPLYEDGLCRYCWMLAQVPTIPEAQPLPPSESPESVLGRRQALRIAATGVIAIIVMWAAAWLIVYLVAYL